MTEFTSEEIEGIVKAIEQKPLPKETQIPLKTPISKVVFPPLQDKTSSPRPLTQKEKEKWHALPVTLEVVFGSTRLTLKEIASLESGSVIPFDQKSSEPLEILINGKRFCRGEIVTVEGHFGVKILDCEQNTKML